MVFWSTEKLSARLWCWSWCCAKELQHLEPRSGEPRKCEDRGFLVVARREEVWAGRRSWAEDRFAVRNGRTRGVWSCAAPLSW